MSDIIGELTEADKSTVLVLAKDGPKCGYDFHLGGLKERNERKAMMSNSTWLDVLKHLGSQGYGLIDIVHKEKDEQRGRPKNKYWLTKSGLIVAFGVGASISSVKYWIGKIMPNDEEADAIVELCEMWGAETIAETYSLTRQKGKKITLDRLPLDDEKIDKFAAFLEKHPSFIRKASEKSSSFSRLAKVMKQF